MFLDNSRDRKLIVFQIGKNLAEALIEVNITFNLQPTFRTSTFTTCIGHEDSTV